MHYCTPKKRSNDWKKHNKNTENDKNSNRCDVFAEDIEIENTEYEEELFKQKIEETENKMKQKLEKE